MNYATLSAIGKAKLAALVVEVRQKDKNVKRLCRKCKTNMWSPNPFCENCRRIGELK